MITLGRWLLGFSFDSNQYALMAVQDLTRGSVGSQLTRMTIPFFLGISSMILGSMIETIYVGMLGAKELAAYSFMFPVIMALTSLSMGVGIGASSVISRAEGSGRRELAIRYATHTFILTTVLSVLLISTVYFWLEDLYAMIGAEGEVLALVVSFAQIWVLGLFTFTLPMVASTVLRAFGIAKAPGSIMTISALVQIIVSPILIFGLFGLPAFGLLGSAYSFILVGVFRVAAFVYLVFREDILLHGQVFQEFMLSVRDILKIAVPAMLSNLIGPITLGITIALLAAHGDSVVAGFGIVSRIEMLITMILGALASSIAPFVGQNWGAGKIDRIRRGLFISYVFCICWGVVCFLLLAPSGEFIVTWINDDADLIDAATWFLIIVPISFGLMGVGNIAGSLFIALGKPIPPTLLSILRSIVIYLPLAIYLDNQFGYIGIFSAIVIANFAYGAAAFLWGRLMFEGELRKAVAVPAAAV